MHNTQDAIRELRQLGISKYKMAKTIGVTWQCIHAYERGWYAPEGVNKKNLQSFYIDQMEKAGLLFKWAEISKIEVAK